MTVEIKGTTVRDTLQGLGSRLGRDRCERLLGLLDADSQRMFRERIIASQWYPLDPFTRLLEADIREHDQGDPSALTKRSEVIFEKQLSGIYRMFILVGSPESLIHRIAAAHATYFRGTQVEVASCERGEALVRYTGFEAHHWILDHAIIGFHRKGLELSGAHAVEARIATPIRQGKGYSEIALSWA
ncbi:MAG: hypothetical protein ACJ79T_00245 [Myxococcales bacterium]